MVKTDALSVFLFLIQIWSAHQTSVLNCHYFFHFDTDIEDVVDRFYSLCGVGIYQDIPTFTFGNYLLRKRFNGVVWILILATVINMQAYYCARKHLIHILSPWSCEYLIQKKVFTCTNTKPGYLYILIIFRIIKCANATRQTIRI